MRPWTVAGGEAGGKWPLAGRPPAEFFQALRDVEEDLNAYALACGLAGVPSPDTVLRVQLENMVTFHALMRARKGDEPGAAEWRTAERGMRTLVRNALKFDIVPFLIPPGSSSFLRTVLRCRLPGGMERVRAVGWCKLERADLTLLAKRAALIRDRQGRKRNEALSVLLESVCDAIEISCPGSVREGWDHINQTGAGLPYKVFAKLQPWLLGLENLTPNALRLALRRADRRGRFRKSSQRVKFRPMRHA